MPWQGAKGMEYSIIILIAFLLKKRTHLKREGDGIDAASKDAPLFAKLMEFMQGMLH